MLAIRLPEEVEKRLDALAKVTGRTKTFMRAKPSWNIWMMWKMSIWPKSGWRNSARVTASPSLSTTLPSAMAWRIEFDPAAEKGADGVLILKLRDASLGSCGNASCPLKTRVASDKPLKAHGLASSGNTGWVIIES